MAVNHAKLSCGDLELCFWVSPMVTGVVAAQVCKVVDHPNPSSEGPK